MKQILLFLCFCSCSILTFGQQVILEADFEKERQRLIDELNPVFAKVKNANGSIRTILKSDEKAVREFYENFYKYYANNLESVRIDTSLYIQKQEKTENSDEVNHKLVPQRINFWSKIYIFEEVTIGHWSNELAAINKKRISDTRQQTIDKFSPIYAKIEIYTPNGNKPKSILKTDTIAIKQFSENIHKYQFVKSEKIVIDTIIPIWVKQNGFNCCFGPPKDCLTWRLIEVSIDTTITIDVYKLKYKEPLQIQKPQYNRYSLTKEEFAGKYFDYEKQKAEAIQKALIISNWVYAKVESVYDGNVFSTEFIAKIDTQRIETIKNQPEIYVLYDIEIVDIKTRAEYWKVVKSDCAMSKWAWCLVEQPIHTTEIIEIYRKQSTSKPEQKTVKTDIIKSTKTSNYNVFPNPFANTITIDATVILNKIIVFDQQGKIVFQQDLNEKHQTVDLSNLPQAVYYLKMVGEKFQETVKLMKQ